SSSTYRGAETPPPGVPTPHRAAGIPLLLLGNPLPELLEPGRGLGVARRAPVTPRRQRAPRPDLGSVRHGRAFELADLEETEEEDLQPAADGGQVVFVPRRRVE